MDDNTCFALEKLERSRFTKRLRRRLTEAELRFWEQVRNRRFLNLKFRRQVNIKPYVVDFLCKEFSIVVEIDGSSHDDRKEYDADRDAFLMERGYRVLRFSNQDVMYDMSRVLQVIAKTIEDLTP